jgi:hypothetical protein
MPTLGVMVAIRFGKIGDNRCCGDVLNDNVFGAYLGPL